MRTAIDLRLAANELAVRLSQYRPTVVVGIVRGGEHLGCLVAQRLQLPFHRLDVAYPASRSPLGRLGEAALFPFKEILYRLSSPRHRGHMPLLGAADIAVLVDDTASSGRTVAVALGVLARCGIERERVVVAVGRCGKRARRMVDVALDR